MTPIPRIRVKICGITRLEDGVMAAQLGADAIGLVFYPPSPRYVSVETARRIVAALPPLISIVGLFMNAEPEAVQAVLTKVPLHLLQFHGDEEPDVCAAFGLPYLKAVPMGAGADIRDYEQRFASASGLLLDSHGGQKNGWDRSKFRLDADSRPAPKTIDPGRRSISRQCCGSNPTGSALRGRCQQWRGIGQGRQGRRTDARVSTRCVRQ